jgi:DNA helicase HerA-like ATPase
MTASGKTTLMANLIQEYRKPRSGQSIKVIVYDPMHDPRLKADFNTASIEKFLAVCQDSQSCMCVVDESGEVIGRYDSEYFWLATRSRHYGHKMHFIAQRANQISKTVRDQCSQIFIFRQSKDDSKLLAAEFGDDLILDAANLQQGEYIFAGRFQKAQKMRLPLIERA